MKNTFINRFKISRIEILRECSVAKVLEFCLIKQPEVYWRPLTVRVLLYPSKFAYLRLLFYRSKYLIPLQTEHQNLKWIAEIHPDVTVK